MGFGGADGFHKTGTGVIPPEFGSNVLIVSKNPNPGQFSTIEAALASIATNSNTNQFLIYVEPGVFVENQLQMKPFVYVQGSGDIITVVRAAPALNDSKFILGCDNSQICDLFIDGGTSFAGLGPNQVGVYHSGQGTGNSFIVSRCVFGKHYTCAWAEGVAATTILRLSNIRAGGAISAFVTYCKATNTPGIPTIAYADQLSYAKAAAVFPTDFFFGHGVGVQFAIVNCIAQTTLLAPTNFINAYDGIQVVCTNSSFSRSNGIGVWIQNSGSPPLLNITSLTLSQINSDIQVDHIMASGEIQGSFALDNLILASDAVSVFGVDPEGGGIVASNKISLIFDDGTITDISTSVIETSPMGLISGGVLTDGGGLNINVSAYTGYCSTGSSPSKVLRLEEGLAQALALPPNVASYIYITSANLLTSSSAIPDTTQNILLGRVVTDGANIIIINTVPLDTRNISNSFDDLLRNALGSIYAAGSIATENVTPFKLDVSSGQYYFAENAFNPSGGIPITFADYVNGASIGNTDTVNHTQYDNGGVPTPYTAGFYGKSTLYISGDGIYEKYFVVRSQAQYATLLAAQQADLPLPPGYFDSGVTLIAAIIVQQGAANISQIIDSRPVIGFKASGVNASADHLSLLNLNTGNAGHFQFMMLNGSTPMAGTLDMGTNPISNVTTINGILPADWYKNGGNAFGGNATIGLTDNFSLGIRTNNTDRITISNTGVVGIPNLGGGGNQIVMTNNAGTISVGATTSILPEGSNLYFTDARAIAAPLTGFVVGLNTPIVAADSILSAFGKTQGQIDALAAGTVLSVTGTANRISITGTAQNPIINIDANYVGQNTITTLGTIATGVWNGTIIGTGFTQAQVISVTGTANRISIGGTATNPTINIDAAYIGQNTITTLGTITTGVWNGTVITTGFTQAQVISVTGTANRISIGGTATNPTVNIDANYVGQNTITTLGTITTGVWNGTTIGTGFTQAQVISVTGTAGRISIGGTPTNPTIDIDAAYIGQNTITTLGTITTGVWNGTAIADANIATPYIKADGTRALTANWAAGAFQITANGVQIGSAANTISTAAATNLSIVTGTTGALSLDSGTTGAVNIGTGAAAKTITIGNVTGATAVNINVGTGGFTLDGVAASNYAIGNSTTTGTIGIGGLTQSGAIQIGGTQSTSTISIGATINTNQINIANGAGASTIFIGSAGAAAGVKTINIGVNQAANVITIGTVTGAASVAVNTGTAGFVLTTTNGVITMNSGTGTISIGTDAAAKTITIGNATGATSATINTGTGGFTVLTATTGIVSIRSGTTGAVTFDSGTTGAVNVGNGANAKAITIGNTTGATSITISSGTGAINIGTAIAKTITIGNVTGATAVNVNTGTGGTTYTTTNGIFTLNTGTGAINLGADAAAKTITIGNITGTTAVNVNTGTGGTTYTTTNGIFTLITGTGTISIGADAAAKTISIGTGAVANTITIGSATVNNTINLSANRIGMYGVAAVARQAAVTPAAGGLIVDTEARAAINTLITRIQTIGITL